MSKMDFNTFTTKGKEETLTLKQLNKLFSDLAELNKEKPKALILIPAGNGFNIYKTNAKRTEAYVRLESIMKDEDGSFPFALSPKTIQLKEDQQ